MMGVGEDGSERAKSGGFFGRLPDDAGRCLSGECWRMGPGRSAPITGLVAWCGWLARWARMRRDVAAMGWGGVGGANDASAAVSGV